METFKKYLPMFLEELRDKGVPVGIREMHWLHRVFALQPALGRQGLRDVLLCTLIKTPQQRQHFEDLFEVWCPPELPDRSSEKEPVKGEITEVLVDIHAEETATVQPIHTRSPSSKTSPQSDEPEFSRLLPPGNTSRRRILLWIFTLLAAALGVQLLI